MLETALEQPHGHKQEAARLLGWGRNPLTRKLKELDFPELGWPPATKGARHAAISSPSFASPIMIPTAAAQHTAAPSDLAMP
jgi:hypothetical protein